MSLLNIATISDILVIFLLWESPNFLSIYTKEISNECIILRGEIWAESVEEQFLHDKYKMSLHSTESRMKVVNSCIIED
jgi:hypothetical protein